MRYIKAGLKRDLGIHRKYWNFAPGDVIWIIILNKDRLELITCILLVSVYFLTFIAVKRWDLEMQEIYLHVDAIAYMYSLSKAL